MSPLVGLVAVIAVASAVTFKFGPMGVKVMDVFVKRDGKWQAVRSQSVMVK
jgi:hypothetical protein